MNGKIARIFHEKQFGFIKPDQGGVDVFFHRSGCTGFEDLAEGDRVVFETKPTPKGPRAEDVEKE